MPALLLSLSVWLERFEFRWNPDHLTLRACTFTFDSVLAKMKQWMFQCSTLHANYLHVP